MPSGGEMPSHPLFLHQNRHFHGQTTVFKDIRPDETDISASDAHISGKYLRIYENVGEKRLHLYD